MCKFVILLVSLIILGVCYVCIFMNLYIYKGQAVAVGLAWLPVVCEKCIYIYKKLII